MKREDIREITMRTIFQMDVAKVFDFESIDFVAENTPILKEKQAKSVLSALRDHIDDIDKTISDNIDSWTIERLAKTDLAILRNAVCEILYVDSIPVAVSINEAVELAKLYGDDKSPKFINAVLGKISKQALVTGEGN